MKYYAAPLRRMNLAAALSGGWYGQGDAAQSAAPAPDWRRRLAGRPQIAELEPKNFEPHARLPLLGAQQALPISSYLLSNIAFENGAPWTGFPLGGWPPGAPDVAGGSVGQAARVHSAYESGRA